MQHIRPKPPPVHQATPSTSHPVVFAHPEQSSTENSRPTVTKFGQIGFQLTPSPPAGRVDNGPILLPAAPSTGAQGLSKCTRWNFVRLFHQVRCQSSPVSSNLFIFCVLLGVALGNPGGDRQGTDHLPRSTMDTYTGPSPVLKMEYSQASPPENRPTVPSFLHFCSFFLLGLALSNPEGDRKGCDPLPRCRVDACTRHLQRS